LGRHRTGGGCGHAPHITHSSAEQAFSSPCAIYSTQKLTRIPRLPAEPIIPCAYRDHPDVPEIAKCGNWLKMNPKSRRNPGIRRRGVSSCQDRCRPTR
jgi:hypothetical protein